jgi:hypothetical protein
MIVDMNAIPIWRIVQLFEKRCEGKLVGPNGKAEEFESVTVKGSGKKAFVIKGWVSNSKGPAVRFRAPWGQLSDGQVRFQPTPQDAWDETEELDIDITFDLPKITLIVKFETDNGKAYTAKFWH